MSNFEWRTEEDEWASTKTEAGGTSRSRGRRPWWILVLVVILLAVVAGAAGWLARSQLQQAEALRTDDIVASFTLVNQAAAEHDSEMLTTVLDVSVREWAVTQRDLANLGLLYEPAGFDFWRLPDRVQIESVEYAPSLRAAEVVILETYQVSEEREAAEVQLWRTDHYRRTDRWQWAAPDDDYWQGRANEQWNGQRLNTYFPTRDQDLSIRLSQDLDALLARLCEQTRNIDCPEPLRVQLRLARDPETMLHLASGSQQSGYFGRQLPYYANGLGVTLPAPSLIGRPVDEAAYQALYRGYARHLVAALLAGLVHQPWSDSQPVYEAALRSFLVELGLLPWPAADQAEAILQPMPKQDIQLVCQDEEREGTVLYRLDLSTMSWWPEWYIEQHLVDLAAAPDGEGVFLHVMLSGSALLYNQVAWWHDGELTLIHSAEASGLQGDEFYWQVRQEDDQLIVRVPSKEPTYLTGYLYDLSECLDQACATRVDRLHGRPLWSPDGSQLLVQASGMLWLRQGNGDRGLTTRRLDEGMIPFWLNSQRFGYVRLRAGVQQDVVVTQGASAEAEIMFTLEDLYAALPVDDRPDRLYIGYIDPGPTGGGQWSILALGLLSDGDLGDAYLFTYAPESDRLTLVLRSPYLNSFNVSPDGRLLAASIFDTGNRRWNLEIHDTIAGESRELSLGRGGRPQLPPFYEWSTDNQWLLALEQGRLVLYPSATGQQRILSPPTPGCVQAVWVNRD